MARGARDARRARRSRPLHSVYADQLIITLCTLVCAPFLIRLAKRLPLPLAGVGEHSAVAMAMLLVVALVPALILSLHDSDVESWARIPEILVVATGLYLMPYFVPFGLSALACLVVMLFVAVLLCEAERVSWRWIGRSHGNAWHLVSTCEKTVFLVTLCSCLFVGLSNMGQLPYVVGSPRQASEAERAFDANEQDVRTLMDLVRWDDVSYAEGVRLLQTAAMVEASALGIPPEEEPVVQLAVIANPEELGYYDVTRNVIVISLSGLREIEGEQGPYALMAICHEMAHAWQFRALDDPTLIDDAAMPLEVDKARLKTWSDEFGSYVTCGAGRDDEYLAQDCEQFADEYARYAYRDFWRRLRG